MGYRMGFLSLQLFATRLDVCLQSSKGTCFHQKLNKGPNPNGPRSVSCDRVIRYSGFFGVRSLGPFLGDFLECSPKLVVMVVVL